MAKANGKKKLTGGTANLAVIEFDSYGTLKGIVCIDDDQREKLPAGIYAFLPVEVIADKTKTEE